MLISIALVAFCVVHHALGQLVGEQRELILQLHNEARQKILDCQVTGQPSAVIMSPLVSSAIHISPADMKSGSSPTCIYPILYA